MPSDKNFSIFRHLNLPSGPILAAEKKTRSLQNLHSVKECKNDPKKKQIYSHWIFAWIFFYFISGQSKEHKKTDFLQLFSFAHVQ